ncbi:MAG TPA: hypothetical protein VNJ11_11130 [Bryobacteraceae bacterium]|nr:hypothetical protein [Bryobacteraceae bacterium]
MCRRMSRSGMLWAAFLVALLAAPLEAGAPKEATVRWEDVAPLVEKRQIETVLANGVHIRGRVERVLPQALVVEVKRTSDPNLVPKGRTQVPRKLLSSFTVRWREGPARALLAVGLPLAVPYFLFALGLEGDDLNPRPANFVVFGVAPVVGYLLGAAIDTKSLRVVLEKPCPAPARASSGDTRDHAPIGEGDCNGHRPELPRRTTAQAPMPDAEQAGDPECRSVARPQGVAVSVIPLTPPPGLDRR